jgi:acetylornithine deacetylase
VELLHSHTEAVTGRAPAFVAAGGWTDAALFADARIPAVVWGPSGGGAHALEEWADLPSIDHCVDVLVRVAEEFCG